MSLSRYSIGSVPSKYAPGWQSCVELVTLQRSEILLWINDGKYCSARFLPCEILNKIIRISSTAIALNRPCIFSFHLKKNYFRSGSSPESGASYYVWSLRTYLDLNLWELISKKYIPLSADYRCVDRWKTNNRKWQFHSIKRDIEAFAKQECWNFRGWSGFQREHWHQRVDSNFGETGKCSYIWKVWKPGDFSRGPCQSCMW